MITTQKDRLDVAKAKLEKDFAKTPDVFMILGSGLGGFVDNFTETTFVPYREIPHFLTSTVPGHLGRLAAGYIGDKYVVAMQGRFHYYEGYYLHDVTFPIRVLSSLGTKNLILTNASGILNPEFKPSDLMLIQDHLNLMGSNPLMGPNNEELGPRFPEMVNIYTNELQAIAKAEAVKLNIPLKEGIYAAVSGPSYETPAEVRMLRNLGADAVGMSTVPEAIVAKYCGMRVLGISCLSNYGAGLSDHTMSHEEVLENSDKVKVEFADLLLNIIPKL